MKALALVESPDHVCCRYRIRPFTPAFESAGGSLQIEGLARGGPARWRQLRRAGRHDVVILQRKLLAGWDLYLLRKSASRLVFDLDDAVLFRDSNDLRGPNCPRRARRFARLVRAADCVIAGNRFLADLAVSRTANQNTIVVIPTCIDQARYVSSPISTRQREDDTFTLVWIGSSSTLRSLEASRALWEHLGQAVPGLRLMVIADRFPRFQSLPVIERIWSEQTEASDLAEGDAGLAHMPDDVWSQGKCGLKILQYFAAAKPVVANPVGIHREMVIPGANGWLAESRDDWTGVINRLRSDKSERIAMGLAGRELATRAFSVQTWANRWVEAVTGRDRRTGQTESRPSRIRDQPARVAVGNPAPSMPLRHGGVA